MVHGKLIAGLNALFPECRIEVVSVRPMLEEGGAVRPNDAFRTEGASKKNQKDIMNKQPLIAP